MDPLVLSFRFHFYPADPTRLGFNGKCMLFQQLKRDLIHGRLYCSPNESAALGALIVQGKKNLMFWSRTTRHRYNRRFEFHTTYRSNTLHSILLVKHQSRSPQISFERQHPENVEWHLRVVIKLVGVWGDRTDWARSDTFNESVCDRRWRFHLLADAGKDHFIEVAAAGLIEIASRYCQLHFNVHRQRIHDFDFPVHDKRIVGHNSFHINHLHGICFIFRLAINRFLNFEVLVRLLEAKQKNP